MDDRGPQFLGVLVGFLALTWVFVSLRCYVRLCLIRAFALDDWLIIIAQLIFTVYAAFGIASVQYGAGRHVTEIPTEDAVTALKMFYFTEITYLLTLSVFRVAIGVFLLRIAIERPMRYTIYAVNSSVVIYTIVFLALILTQCKPLSFFWERARGPFAPPGFCDEPTSVASTRAMAVLGIITDFTLALLPLWFLWGLVLKPAKKIAVGVLIGLSAVASIAAIIRFPYLEMLLQSHDFLYANVDTGIWSTIEPGIGIFAVCLATLRPLLTKLNLNSILSFSTDFHGGASSSKAPATNTLSAPTRRTHRTEAIRLSTSASSRPMTGSRSKDGMESLDSLESGELGSGGIGGVGGGRGLRLEAYEEKRASKSNISRAREVREEEVEEGITKTMEVTVVSTV